MSTNVIHPKILYIAACTILLITMETKGYDGSPGFTDLIKYTMFLLAFFLPLNAVLFSYCLLTVMYSPYQRFSRKDTKTRRCDGELAPITL